jgi:hypothetical protein
MIYLERHGGLDLTGYTERRLSMVAREVPLIVEIKDGAPSSFAITQGGGAIDSPQQER